MDGRPHHREGAGDGVGEIALLRAMPAHGDGDGGRRRRRRGPSTATRSSTPSRVTRAAPRRPTSSSSRGSRRVRAPTTPPDAGRPLAGDAGSARRLVAAVPCPPATSPTRTRWPPTAPSPTTARPTPASGTATRSPTAPTGPARARCSRRSGSPTTTSRSRSSASRRRGSRRCPATSTSAASPSRVKEGIRAAGGTPMEFNTIAVTDGVSMGTEGMKASLISREVIADSIELVARGHLFDGIVCLVGCDKTIPAGRDGTRPPRHPGARPLQRHDLPRHLQGRAGGRRHGVRGDRRVPRGQDHASRSCTRSRTAPAPAPARAAASSRPTRWRRCSSSSASRPAGLNGIPAEDPAKDEAARQAGELVMTLVRHDIRPARHRHPQLVRERDRVRLRDRRQHQRRPPPARDRGGVRHDR